MQQQIIFAILGLCGGLIVAGGVTGLMIGLSIIPRYAGITGTKDRVTLYEDASLMGTVLGNLYFLFHWHLPGGWLFLAAFGMFTGIFLGAWIMALAEMADVFPIFSRRIRLQTGIPWIIVSLALGKTFGSLLYYYMEWVP